MNFEKIYTGLTHTHKLVVTLFLLIYLIKTVLLLLNKKEALRSFSKKVKVPEMIISFLFLATGIAMIIELPQATTFFIIKLVAVFASIPIAIVGFKKENKGLAALSLILLFGAYGMAEAHKGKLRKGGEVHIEAGQDVVTVGKAVYEVKCVVCHGEDGARGAGGAKDLTVSEMSQEEAHDIILNGKGLMASYKDQLSEEEIQAVSTYVMTLKKQ
ncbi:cytochrome c [Limibacter armeniacum]|uniref:c-type cytochrome n=1 Tax=Limibacter armeniacum TaxID=466084 RepID=UPI002FE633F1